MSLVTRLIYARRGPFKRAAKELLALYGLEVPAGVTIGRDLRVMHRGFGTVIHPATIIGNRVTIYHGVTVGRSDPWVPASKTRVGAAIIGDDVTLCPGATVVAGAEGIRVAPGTVLGAGAVLTKDTEPGEIWAGVPARRVGMRDDYVASSV
jgi:serine O-acetyltransferase